METLRQHLTPDEIAEAVAWRHHLHRHPELAFQETNTAAFIAERLAGWGYKVSRGLGGTGVVGTLSKGTGHKAIGLRADMDALPITEASGVDYSSTVPGVMHACGHDGHVAMLLAAAQRAVQLPIDGTLHLVFQPAEENEAGARVMVEQGLFQQHPMDAIFGMHNWPALDSGQVVARDSAMMAALGTFEIVITGQGAHGAMPHEGQDVLVAAASIVSGLQTIVSRNLSPLESGVVSVTQIHGGDAWNVLPESVLIRGTTRWFSDLVGQTIASRLSAVCDNLAQGFGCRAEVRHDARYPATINDPQQAAFVRATCDRLGLGVVDADPSMAAEDFAFMLRETPGCYFWLGARRDGDNPGLHSPRYDFNDLTLATGAHIWLGLIEDQLAA